MSPEKESKKKNGFIPNTSSGSDDSLSTQVDDPRERVYFRRSVLLFGGAFLVMFFFFTAAFFLAVRGAEKTVVPEIIDEDLTEALVILQERELYPRIQAKFTGDPSDKGRVIDQNPEPGLYVKAGRRVTVTVSKGAIVDNVEEYVGMSVTEVRGRLASLFSTFDPLLIISEPITYVYHDSEPGTVISQSPEVGTPLGDPQDLILIVSRGNLDRPVIVPDMSEYNAENAMRALARIPLPFIFEEADVEPTGYVARVTGQSPAAESEIAADGGITLRYSPPESIPSESRYGLFDYWLPNYAVPVRLEVMIREPGAEDRNLFSMPHSGGRLAFPYVLPVGSSVVVIVNGEDTIRHNVVSETSE